MGIKLLNDVLQTASFFTLGIISAISIYYNFKVMLNEEIDEEEIDEEVDKKVIVLFI